MSAAVLHVLRLIGSHNTTLVLLGLMALAVIAGLNAAVDTAEWVALPLAGLFVNLLAAIVAQPTLRAQPMLFAFHVMLAVLVVLIGADRLTALNGHVEITEGAMFDPAQAVVEAGPLHSYRLDEVAFVQGGFDIRYLPGMKRQDTVSQVRIPDAGGGWREAEVGDDDPLIVGNYRFYTSFNKGFAPVITYTGPDGRSLTGAVHMPSYPLNDYKQGNEWMPPGRGPVKLWLSIPEPVYDENGAWSFRKPKNPALVVIDGDQRQELRPGQAVALAGGGSLRFDTLRVWMGYTITANQFSAWMMAVAITACLALAVHLLEKLLPRPTGPAASARLGHVE